MGLVYLFSERVVVRDFEVRDEISRKLRKCPQCGKEAIIKGKEEYGGGWLCFKKKGGCGAKFDDADTKITSQSVGRVANDVGENIRSHMPPSP